MKVTIIKKYTVTLFMQSKPKWIHTLFALVGDDTIREYDQETSAIFFNVQKVFLLAKLSV